MAKIPDEVKEFLKICPLAYVATCGKDGIPHCVPKGGMTVLGDEILVFADLYLGRTKKNIEENPNIAVTIANPAAYRGYEIIGIPQTIEGGGEYERIKSLVEQRRGGYREAKCAIKIQVKKVRSVEFWQ